MGVHKKTATKDVIRFVLGLGESLGYVVHDEEYMFPGDRESPILDVTWRKGAHDDFPLFIFEIESSATKASTDNALKVLSQKTGNYPKPLFLSHLFVDDAADRRRIEDLRNQYDDVNYDTFALGTTSDHVRLIANIIRHHFRVFDNLDLPVLLGLFVDGAPVQVQVSDVLHILLDLKYDLRPTSNFLAELELSILDFGEEVLREFYVSYLPGTLASNCHPPQLYRWDEIGEEDVYFRIVHCALVLLTNASRDYSLWFRRIQIEEDHFWGKAMANGNLGSSSWDDDAEMYSEWPMLLTMLAASFAGTEMSAYFSEKLKIFVAEASHYCGLTPHPVAWLAIASQIANDLKSYSFAAEVVARMGGIPLQAIIEPSLCSGFPIDDSLEPDYHGSAWLESLPSYNRWSFLVGPLVKPPTLGMIESIIPGFLFRNGSSAEEGCRSFACFCLKSSVRSAQSRILT